MVVRIYTWLSSWLPVRTIIVATVLLTLLVLLERYDLGYYWQEERRQSVELYWARPLPFNPPKFWSKVLKVRVRSNRGLICASSAEFVENMIHIFRVLGVTTIVFLLLWLTRLFGVDLRDDYVSGNPFGGTLSFDLVFGWCNFTVPPTLPSAAALSVCTVVHFVAPRTFLRCLLFLGLFTLLVFLPALFTLAEVGDEGYISYFPSCMISIAGCISYFFCFLFSSKSLKDLLVFVAMCALAFRLFTDIYFPNWWFYVGSSDRTIRPIAVSVLASLFSLHFYKVCFRPGNKLSLELIDKQGVKVLLALVAMNMILRGGFPIGLSGRYTLDLFAFSLSFYFCFIMFANVLVVFCHRGSRCCWNSRHS